MGRKKGDKTQKQIRAEKKASSLRVKEMKVRSRRRKGKSAEATYGVRHAIPMATGGSWACPEHGRFVMQHSTRSIASGMDKNLGPYVKYDILHNGRPTIEKTVAAVTWVDHWCPGGHVLRLHYDWDLMKLVPGTESRYYYPEADEEYYPVLRNILPHLYHGPNPYELIVLPNNTNNPLKLIAVWLRNKPST